MEPLLFLNALSGRGNPTAEVLCTKTTFSYELTQVVLCYALSRLLPFYLRTSAGMTHINLATGSMQ